MSLLCCQNKIWIGKVIESGEVVYAKKFHLKLKEDVFKSYLRPANLHGCKVWCLKESETKNQRRQRDPWSGQHMETDQCLKSGGIDK